MNNAAPGFLYPANSINNLAKYEYSNKSSVYYASSEPTGDKMTIGIPHSA
jgi:hypothetical protein